MQPSVSMGSHKASPPDLPEEDVTDEFVQDVLDTLKANHLHNRVHRLAKGDPGYKISNHAELAAEATDGDKTLLSKIIGPVRPTTKVKRIARSRFVGAIRRALELPEPRVTSLTVSADRAETLRRMHDLPDDEFQIFQKEIERLERRRLRR